jgi:hypothetical protein
LQFTPASTESATADSESTRTLRAAIAEADFKRVLDRDEIGAIRGRGRPGSAAPLDKHAPQYAHTRSELERRFLDLCAEHGIPLPEVNVEVEGFTVDAVWRQSRLIVELDGFAGHGTAARMRSDRARELTLRAAGYLPCRYSWHQVVENADAVATDVLAAIDSGSRGGRSVVSTPAPGPRGVRMGRHG